MPKNQTTIHFTSFPQTTPPPSFVHDVVTVFRNHESSIATKNKKTGLQSDALLTLLRSDLIDIGFQVEVSKKTDGLITRPVFFGEDGHPAKTYSVDAYNAEHRCGLEIEAGRAVGGNAIYRDLVQTMVMVEVDHLILAVANVYRYGKTQTYDYQTTVGIATGAPHQTELPSVVSLIPLARRVRIV